MPKTACQAVCTAVLTVSVVSHGHDAWLRTLLAQLAHTGAGTIAHVVVTHNCPGAAIVAPPGGWPFTLTEIANPVPRGFGANHNSAFLRATTPLFAVLNPDISLPDPAIWTALAECASQQPVGCAYPVLRNTDGSVQDNQREVPTPWALLRRRLLGRVETRVHWVSAAFWVVPAAAYQAVQGFDERYFLYCEDTDFCLRLQLAGWTLAQVPAQAVHHAQRRSHRRLQHLAWHLASLLRLWRGRPLWAYLRQQTGSLRPPVPHKARE